MELLYKSIQFEKEITSIPYEDLGIIMQSRKTVLFHNQEPWVKREEDEDFDVPMGCYDGAEVSELVGSYLLNKLLKIVDKELVGLHRDDGFDVLRNLSGPQTERKRKAIVNVSVKPLCYRSCVSSM